MRAALRGALLPLASLLLLACSPEITQEALFRDPHGVAVYDERSRVLLPTGRVAQEATTQGHPALLSWTQVKVRRDEDGAIWVGPSRSLVDAQGRASVIWQANHHPVIGEPAFRDGAVYLSFPYQEGRSESTRLTFASPLSNVIRIREIREPRFSGIGLIFGTIFTAAGTAMIVDATTRSGRTTAQRTTELALSPVMLFPGLLGLGVDIYALAASRSERVLYEAQ